MHFLEKAAAIQRDAIAVAALAKYALHRSLAPLISAVTSSPGVHETPPDVLRRRAVRVDMQATHIGHAKTQAPAEANQQQAVDRLPVMTAFAADTTGLW